MARIARFVWTAVRWWFGVTWLAAGLGCVAAAPVMLALANAGGIYMLIGGAMLAFMGWHMVPRRPRLRRRLG